MDRTVTSLGDASADGQRGERKRVKQYVPPVLSLEKAEELLRLKPFLNAVNDLNRLAILQELGREDGLSVLDLSDRLTLSQPLTSWHLLILRRAQLVSSTHRGRQRIYRLNRARLEELREQFARVTEL